MEKLYYELKAALKRRNLFEFPSFANKEDMPQEILTLYKEFYVECAKRMSLQNGKDDFVDYAPLLMDFADLPIYCDNVNDILDSLKDEDTVADLEIASEAPKGSDFVTAAGSVIEKTPINDSQSDGIDKESGIEEKILERIKFEILDNSPNISWSDIAGLDGVKKSVNEIVVWPMQRPDIFTGLRAPPKGLLLFGPPGTGKTMIGKCIASQCDATFFSISASSLTSKWVGEGEKMVRALFFLARKMQPSVVFIDEIDSLLSQRKDNENDGMRRIKTEFLVQFDGAGTSTEEKILVIGATNRPHEIDEAARRRLVKRIYVPLPDKNARTVIARNLLSKMTCNISEEDFEHLAVLTEGYSGSDMYNLCREASMEPIREILDIKNAETSNTRAINYGDFCKAVKQIRKSVCDDELDGYVAWNAKFGST